ncbi:hypothetical protein OLQ22_08745 [Campylobacter jejuni]|nr:hypothetical protein [Campylobacter jejuni]
MKKKSIKKTCLISAITASILSPIYAFEIDVTRVNSSAQSGGGVNFI